MLLNYLSAYSGELVSTSGLDNIYALFTDGAFTNPYIAVKKLNSIIDANREYPEFYKFRGNAYADMERFDLAMKDYKKALSIKNNYAVIYNNIGTVYASQGKYQKAKEYYRKALIHDPAQPIALTNMAHHLINKKRYNDAQIYINKISDNNEKKVLELYLSIKKDTEKDLNTKDIPILKLSNTERIYIIELLKIKGRYNEAEKIISEIIKKHNHVIGYYKMRIFINRFRKDYLSMSNDDFIIKNLKKMADEIEYIP